MEDECGVAYTKDWENLFEGTKVIGDWAFYGCESLKSINIPNSVTSIGDSAFEWCDSLKSIYIPKGTKEKFSKILGRMYSEFLVEIDI